VCPLSSYRASSPSSQVLIWCYGTDVEWCVRRHIPVPAVPNSLRRICYYVALTVWSNHDADIYIVLTSRSVLFRVCINHPKKYMNAFIYCTRTAFHIGVFVAHSHLGCLRLLRNHDSQGQVTQKLQPKWIAVLAIRPFNWFSGNLVKTSSTSSFASVSISKYNETVLRFIHAEGSRVSALSNATHSSPRPQSSWL